MSERTVRIYPSQLQVGDYGNGRRYAVTVTEAPEPTRPGWFTGKPQVSVRVIGGIPPFHRGERAESFYRGERIEVVRPS